MNRLKIWTDALRSGLYTQTSDTLMQGEWDETSNLIVEKSAFCCLGVACLVADLSEEEYLGEDLPPSSLQEWLTGHLTEPGPADIYLDFPEDLRDRESRMLRYTVSCAHMNDSMGLTFEQIADVLDYFGVRAA